MPETTEYFRKKGGKYRKGLYSQCRSCEDNYNKEYRRKNRKKNALKAKEYKRKLRSLGLCIQCGSRKATHKSSSMCEMDYIKNICNANLKDSSRWQEIKNLLIWQDYKCAISGVPIDFGKKASIDHIIPRSKGGTDSIENLQLVHVHVNTMKLDLLMEDFLEFCKKILLYNNIYHSDQ